MVFWIIIVQYKNKGNQWVGIFHIHGHFNMVQATYKHCISHTNPVFLACITGIIFSHFSGERRQAQSDWGTPDMHNRGKCVRRSSPALYLPSHAFAGYVFLSSSGTWPHGYQLRRLNCILQGVPLQSVSTAIDPRTECHGSDDWGHTNTKALKILDYRNCYWLDLCRAQMTT